MVLRNRFIIFLLFFGLNPFIAAAQSAPNVVIIYSDDLGYGDVSAYGAKKISTPNIDKLAAQGIRFTNAHSASATCTPSRYALMTGNYPWRKSGTGILPGNAALIIPPSSFTLQKLFQQNGYTTGIVGKWHLGLGTDVDKNWNAKITPGPNETGFDYSFIFPATADRVPTIFIENGSVVGAESTDPILVDYKKKIGTDPTGLEHPELLKMKSSPGQGHNNTIVNGIGRIGFMSGGINARWTDEEMPLTFLEKARMFIQNHKKKPFFLFYALTEPHVPRMPSTMFKGKSGLGFRGDAILQLDWTVGEIMRTLQQNGLSKNTIIIFTSDNGPVLDDGYQDGAVTQLNGHDPFGGFRGGKYSAYEGGTRVPFIINWPKAVKPAVSGAMICQMDLMASFSKFFGKKVNAESNSVDMWNVLIGKSSKGRKTLVQQGLYALALVDDDWKYIEPNNHPAMDTLTNIELANSTSPQLFNLKNDIAERKNLAKSNPEKLRMMEEKLERIKQKR